MADENSVRFHIDGKTAKPLPADLTSTGYPFYSGKAAFTYTVDMEAAGEGARIQVNHVRAAAIELFVNGSRAG